LTKRNRCASQFWRTRRGRGRVEEQIRRLKEEELNLIFDNAFHDREKAEVFALTESSLLDVHRGEVLRNARYIRVFEF